MPATGQTGGIRLERDQAARIRQLSEGRKLKAFPEMVGKRSIGHGGGVLVWLLGGTNNLTWISRRHLLQFPLIRDEPFFIA
jgi:hypothetical protein